MKNSNSVITCPKGCMYEMRQENLRHCGYILITGHMRDCDPGYGCTRYVKASKEWAKTNVRLEPKQCIICGKQFEPATRWSVYCSKACAKEAANRKSKECKARKKDKTKEPEERICDICGAVFVPHRYWEKRCSPECKKEFQKRYRKERYEESVREKQKEGNVENDG